MVDLIEAALNRKLDGATAQWKPQTAVGVVLAAQNYPDTPRKGDVIHGIDAANHIGKVFHAGTAVNERGEVVTNGGRVLCVVGLGDDVAAAKQRAYRAWQRFGLTGCSIGRILRIRRWGGEGGDGVSGCLGCLA